MTMRMLLLLEGTLTVGFSGLSGNPLYTAIYCKIPESNIISYNIILYYTNIP